MTASEIGLTKTNRYNAARVNPVKNFPAELNLNLRVFFTKGVAIFAKYFSGLPARKNRQN